MSRLKNFARNLTTSYIQLAVNVVYSLISVPLILHWLPQAEFGLWALLVQLMGYITLIDLGMNQAIARFLVDHKDQRTNGDYGALVKTSILVSIVQGFIVLVIVAAGSPLLAELMKIPVVYQETFVSLMRIQGLIAAFLFFTNPLAIVLYAHQRMDLVARQGMVTQVFSLGALVIFLSLGSGIYAFVYAGSLAALIAPLQLFWHCRRLRLLPQAGEWGSVSWRQFKDVFLYGKDIFLINLGAQLITTSQTIIISRELGLDAAAAWSVATKIFLLARQIMFQPFGAASAGLSEMVVRNETEQMRMRFKNLVTLTASLGVFSAVGFAMCNSLFVGIWTSGRILWSPWNDILLGVWLFVTALQLTHCNFVSITKQIGRMRYLYFFEGCTFVVLALATGKRWGMPGILVCSTVCVILFSYLYGLWRSSIYFRLRFSDLAVEWVCPSLKFAAALLPIALLLWLATSPLPPVWRLVIHGITVGIIGGLLFLRVGLPVELIRDMKARLPSNAGRLLTAVASFAV